MSDYRLVTVDLTAGANRQELVPRRTSIYDVTVLTQPPGATFALHFGDHEAIPTVQGMTFDDPRGCAIENEGLYATFPAQAGVTVTLYVGASAMSAEVS